MNAFVLKSILFVSLVCACGCVFAEPEPQSVPRLTERALDKASYAELVRQWKAYMQKHGESSHALVNIAMAYSFSGEEKAARNAVERAVKIAPDDPAALAFLGRMLALNRDELGRAKKLLEKCREIAPEYDYGMTTLAAVYLKQGELEKADAVFQTIYSQHIISPPLQDYGYNMLIGLTPNAVLVTNGDNDTFPPLSLQAGKGLRKDVVIINRNLLNLKEYIGAVFKRYPSIQPKGVIAPEGNMSLSSTLLKRMAGEAKCAVYFASSVDMGELGFSPVLATEGINHRAGKKGLAPEASAALFFGTYRLDSATDWSFPWSLVPSVSQLMKNYVNCMVALVTEKGDISNETKRKLLEKSLEIATFHSMHDAVNTIRSLGGK